jgi:methylated-DNA-protein-cysteine methyltransferase-like protein
MRPRRATSPERLRGHRLHAETPASHGERESAWEAVWRLVRRIPRGRLMSYGQIAALLGQRLSPRAVGWALHGCPRDVPWQRVVNSRGGISTERLPDLPDGLQRALLEHEGVVFDAAGRCDLERYRFTPAASRRRTKLPTRTARGRSGACRP